MTEQYPVCPRCERDMAPGVSCCDCTWTIDGKSIPALRFGEEDYTQGQVRCRDCNTPRGGTHHYGCTIEYCPHRNQAITCDACPVLDHDPYAPKLN